MNHTSNAVVPTVAPSAAAIQVNRITGLNDLRTKTVSQEDADLGRLVRMLVMGTDRILVELRKQIALNATVTPSEQDLMFQTSAVYAIMPHMERLSQEFLEIEASAQTMHLAMQGGTAESYLAQFETLTQTIETAFVHMEAEFALLQAKLTPEQQETGYFKSMTGIVKQARSTFSKIAQIAKEEVVRASKVVAALTMSTSIAMASAPTSLPQPIAPTQPDMGLGTPASSIPDFAEPIIVLKSISQARTEFFDTLAKNPSEITKLPQFLEKTKRIKEKLVTLKYGSGEHWKSWNKGVVRSYFSNLAGHFDGDQFRLVAASAGTEGITLTNLEESIVIRAIQNLTGTEDDGKFGPKSKKSYLAHFQDAAPVIAKNAPLEAKSIAQVTQETQEAVMSVAQKSNLARAISEVAKLKNDLVLRQVSAEEFNETLMGFVGTKYRRGVTDCSGILRIAMKKLGLIDPGFHGNSGQIMKKLTADRRKMVEAQSGDFLYWRSARTQKNNQTAYHIAYVMSVEKLGVWILDSSTDTRKMTKRFLDWTTVAKKRGYAGAAKVLVQATGSSGEGIVMSSIQ